MSAGGLAAGEADSPSAIQAADLAAFRRMLQVAGGTFSLSFAVCNDRRLRDTLIERLCEEFPCIVTVRLPAEAESPLTFASEQVGGGKPAAIFVLDMEASIPATSEVQPALRVLNSSRELWERFRCPVVFWLAEYAMTLLHRHAPDFWRYRSHQFEFVPEPVPLKEVMSERFAGFEMVDALPFEEKAFRVSELERRLAEAGDPPQPDLLPHVLMWIYELAHLYQHANRFGEAETWLRKALGWAESVHGVNHPEDAAALSNLAQVLKATNRLAEAEPLMRRALEIDEASFGKYHPNVARDLNNLARLLQDTNRLQEAELLMRRALEIDEASLGKDHPDVAIRLNNFAQLLKVTNRLAEAELLMRRALEIGETCFGKNHPKVAIRLNNLAQLLQMTNRLTEAEPLMRRALEIDEASFGKDHPKMAIRFNNFARLLQNTNRLAEAEPLMRRALEIFTASYGLEHPSTRTVRGNLELLLAAKAKAEGVGG